MAPSFESELHRYRPALPSWHTRSAVRAKPRRVLPAGDGGLFYSAALTPVAGHPLVTAAGPEAVSALLARRLYAYLDFTTVLEQEIVNPVVLRLSRGPAGLALPPEMCFDAYKIYCDEAYHALFSVDVKRQVEELSGVPAPPLAEPRFARAIRRARRTVPAELADLVDLCAAVVSETLISGTLTDVPDDPTVVGVVRETLADHAADERTHHAYFAQFLELMWPQLPPASQHAMGPVFADLVLAFLRPDWREYWRMLLDLGYGDADAARIIAESHPEAELAADARQSSRSLLALLRKVGVLADPRTAAHFARLGLLPADEPARP